MTIDLKTLKPTKTVDARVTCPLLEARRAMVAVPANGVLEVLSSDQWSNEDIPKWARKAGHDYLGNIDEGGYRRLFVRRGR